MTNINLLANSRYMNLVVKI